MKVINLVLGVMFVAFAALQLNDPDPVLWISIYAGIAGISFFAAFGRYNVWILVVAMTVILVELLRLLPDLSGWIDAGMPSIAGSMKAESPYIELVREFVGVLICFAALVFHFYGYRRRRSSWKASA